MYQEYDPWSKLSIDYEYWLVFSGVRIDIYGEDWENIRPIQAIKYVITKYLTSPSQLSMCDHENDKPQYKSNRVNEIGINRTY